MGGRGEGRTSELGVTVLSKPVLEHDALELAEADLPLDPSNEGAGAPPRWLLPYMAATLHGRPIS